LTFGCILHIFGSNSEIIIAIGTNLMKLFAEVFLTHCVQYNAAGTCACNLFEDNNCTRHGYNMHKWPLSGHGEPQHNTHTLRRQQ